MAGKEAGARCGGRKKAFRAASQWNGAVELLSSAMIAASIIT